MNIKKTRSFRTTTRINNREKMEWQANKQYDDNKQDKKEETEINKFILVSEQLKSAMTVSWVCLKFTVICLRAAFLL